MYNGELYLAAEVSSSNNNTQSVLVQINLQDPSLSLAYMPLTSKNVFGCITLPKSCELNGFYIIGEENGKSFLKELTAQLPTGSSKTTQDRVKEDDQLFLCDLLAYVAYRCLIHTLKWFALIKARQLLHQHFYLVVKLKN